MHDHGLTSPGNMIYSGSLLTNLGVSIAYNFISITGNTKNAFFIVMAELQNIDFLGPGFNRLVFPSLLFLMMLMTMFHVYDWIANSIGFQKFDFD